MDMFNSRQAHQTPHRRRCHTALCLHAAFLGIVALLLPACTKHSQFLDRSLSVGNATYHYKLYVAQKVGKTPTWIFHGAADPLVPVTEARKMAEALKTGGGDVRYTEYEGVDHNAWDRAYAEPDLFSWMLSHTLEKAD
jgi:predicted peptidase